MPRIPGELNRLERSDHVDANDSGTQQQRYQNKQDQREFNGGAPSSSAERHSWTPHGAVPIHGGFLEGSIRSADDAVMTNAELSGA